MSEKIGTYTPADERPVEEVLPSCGDFDMRIARDGTWFYRGTPIGRKPLVRLFSTVLRREADGTFWLVTPVERGQIIVDDAPFTAVDLDVIPDSGSDSGREDGAGEAVLRFRTNVDETVELGPDHPLRVSLNPETGEPSPYIMVRDGLEALLLRPVFYRLVELAVDSKDGGDEIGVWSKGHYFPLGRTT